MPREGVFKPDIPLVSFPLGINQIDFVFRHAVSALTHSERQDYCPGSEKIPWEKCDPLKI
jgi:hypothetical protein